MCGLSFASLFHWLVFLLDVEEDTLICFCYFLLRVVINGQSVVDGEGSFLDVTFCLGHRMRWEKEDWLR